MAVAVIPREDLPSAPVVGVAKRARGVPLMVILAFGFLLLVVLLACFGGMLFPGSPTAQSLFATERPPSATYWFGTDDLGRDVFVRVIAGCQTALIGPSLIAASGLAISSVLGIAAGYLGGAVDIVISRIVDFMFSLPGLLIAIVVVAVVGGGYPTAVIVLSVLNVQGDIRIVRSAAVKQRPLPYVEAARTIGIPAWKIMYRHILLNIAPILIADLALDFGGALVALAGLAFLGLGAPPGSTEWGSLLAEGQGILFANPMAAIGPGLAIVLLSVSFSLIGDWIYERFARSGQRGE